MDAHAVLDTAAAALGTSELGPALMTEVARRCGTSLEVLEEEFGDAEALTLQAVSRALHLDYETVPPLPEQPTDPAPEIGEWAAAQIEALRNHAALRRRCFGQRERHAALWNAVDAELQLITSALTRYARRLVSDGFAAVSADTATAVRMFVATLYADALGSEASSEYATSAYRYTRTFLDALAIPHPV